MRDRMRVSLYFIEEAPHVHHLDDLASRGFTRQSMQIIEDEAGVCGGIEPEEEIIILLEVQFGFRIKDIDQGEPMPAPHFEIVEIMRRGDLHRAGAFFRV